eukprot:m.311256 g.311256  ORF g.311256 m.311256 type:complete len:315 (+) comp63433_c0_seq1:87-1031(+)
MEELRQLVLNGRMPALDPAAGVGPPCHLSRNMCIIVAAVVLRKRDDGEFDVLMMQEAKASCRGLWYLPAGRLEVNESLEEGVTRETLEETGLHLQPTAFLCLENRGFFWQRFTFAGSISGGALKTVERADKESLQAQWVPCKDVEGLSLRALDILPLIRKGREWHQLKEESRFSLLPAPVGHSHFSLGVVLISRTGKESVSDDWNRCQVFSAESEKYRLPCVQFPTNKFISLNEAIFHVVKTELKELPKETTILGLCAVEHLGKPVGAMDGISLAVLAEVRSPSQDEKWITVENSDILRAFKKMTLPSSAVSII